MKIRLTFFLAFFCIVNLFAIDLQPVDGEPPVKVFVMAGQSNFGWRIGLDGMQQYAPEVLAWLASAQNDTLYSWKQDVPGLGTSSNGFVELSVADAVEGPYSEEHIIAYNLCQRWKQENPKQRIAIIKVQQGSTSLIQHWNPGGRERAGGLYYEEGPMHQALIQQIESSLALLDNAGITWEGAGFFWYQGENDCYDAGATYAQFFEDLVYGAQLVTDQGTHTVKGVLPLINNTSAPVIPSRISWNLHTVVREGDPEPGIWGTKPREEWEPHLVQVRDALTQFALNHNGRDNAFVNVDDLPMSDRFHYDQREYIEIGQRMTSAFLNLLAIEVSNSDVSVPEGSTNTFNVRLNHAPESDQIINIARASGDADLSLGSAASLTFTPANWNQWQTVTLQAVEDADTEDGAAVFECSGAGVDAVVVNATEVDNDIAIEVDQTSATVDEGGSTSIQVRLNIAPLTSCTVNIAWLSGDTDITVGAGSELIFTPEDFAIWQTVSVNAAQDADKDNGSAIIRLSSTDAANVDIVVTEVEDDYSVVADGLLASWEMDAIVASPVVTEVAPSTLANGLSQGLLTHSDTSIMRGVNDAIKAIDCDDATLADAITSGKYFTWSITTDADHYIKVTSIVLRTKGDETAVSLALLSDATGLTAADVLLTHTGALETSTVPISMSDASAVEFRLYAYGATSPYNGAYIGKSYATDGSDDIQIYGQVIYSPPATTFDSWATTHGVTASESIDTDNDGINNLLEYAFDLDPNANDNTALPTIATENDSGTDYLTLTYRKNLDAPDLTYTIETITTLGAGLWTAATVESDIVVTADPDGDGSAELRKARVALSGDKQFLRLKVTQ